MGRKLKWIILIVVLAAVAWGLARMGQGGFSARQQPSALETMVATGARSMAIPRAAKEMKNPVQSSPEVLAEARRHFADHCASCHGNDGSGDTDIGRNLYPKAPDMRLPATQDKTDGEIYFVIRNGIRLSGMPAWGQDSDNDKESWALVHFIRHLPKLTSDELQDMQSYNPKSPAEIREEQAEEDFLHGKNNGTESTHQH